MKVLKAFIVLLILCILTWMTIIIVKGFNRKTADQHKETPQLEKDQFSKSEEDNATVASTNRDPEPVTNANLAREIANRYFRHIPLNEGREWHYQVKTYRAEQKSGDLFPSFIPTSEYTEIYRSIGFKTLDDGKVIFAFSFRTEPKQANISVNGFSFYVNNDGVIKYGSDGTRFGYILKKPITTGTSWIETSQSGRSFEKLIITSTNEHVETPAGKFDGCLVVEFAHYRKLSMGLNQRDVEIVEKYAPNIGLVEMDVRSYTDEGMTLYSYITKTLSKYTGVTSSEK